MASPIAYLCSEWWQKKNIPLKTKQKTAAVLTVLPRYDTGNLGTSRNLPEILWFYHRVSIEFLELDFMISSFTQK